MVTYPNQKIVHINKPTYEERYLSVGVTEWQDACKNLKPNTFKLYLYLCSNADGFDLALSRQDAMNKLGISSNSYHRAVEELIESKYIIEKQGNVYDFYTTPQELIYPSMGMSQEGIYPPMGTLYTHTRVHDIPTDEYSIYPSMSTEISKISKINNLSNKEREKEDLSERDRLEKLDNKTLNSILEDYKKKVSYIDIQNKYNFKDRVTKKTIETIESIMYLRKQREAAENLVIPEYKEIDYNKVFAERKAKEKPNKLAAMYDHLW